MITPYVHNEPEWDGKPVFIVQDKTGETRELYGVTFLHGEARLTNQQIAMWFDETHNYDVTLPAGYQPWKLVGPDHIVEADEYVESGARGAVRERAF